MSYLTLLHSTWPYLVLLCPTWLYLALLHSTMALLALLDSTTLYHHSTGIYLTLLHFGMALLDSTGLHYTLPWLYVALLLYYTLPWLYLTRLDSTWLYYNCVKSLWYHWPLTTTSWIETGVLLLSGFCLSGIEPKWVAVWWADHVSQKFAVTNGVRQREGGYWVPFCSLFTLTHSLLSWRCLVMGAVFFRYPVLCRQLNKFGFLTWYSVKQLLLILTTYALMQNSSVLLSPSFWVVKLVLFGFRVSSFVWLNQLHTWVLSPDYWSVWWYAWIFKLSLQKVLG